MEQHLLFFDIDGTILFHNRVPFLVKKAIKDARKAGHYCILNTGRPKVGLPKSVKRMKWDGYICAGSYVEFQGEVLGCELMPEESVRKIMEYLVKDNVPATFDCVGPSYTLHWQGGIPLSSPEELFVDFENKKVNKVEIHRPLSEEALRAIAPYASCYPMNGYVDVFVLGCSKASGMKLIGEKTGIPRERMVAFGDNNNDLDMLRYAGKSVAMKVASDDAVASAAFHATSRRHGVCQGIKKYLRK